MEYACSPDGVTPDPLHLLGTLLALEVVGDPFAAEVWGLQVARGRVAVGFESAVAHVHGRGAGEGAADDELLGAGAEGEGLAGDEVECFRVVDSFDVEVGEELVV